MSAIDLTPAQRDFLRRHIPHSDDSAWHIESAGSAGSDRRFIRVGCGPSPRSQSYVLIVWDSADPDWDRFLGMAREPAGHIEVLPAVYAADPKHGLILEEDLGDRTLKSVCTDSGSSDEIKRVYRTVMETAVRWHGLGAAAGPTIASRSMDEAMYRWESDYFAAHCVRDFFGREHLLDQAWEHERSLLAQEAAALAPACMHRDFQSENIILKDDRVRFVDFQGARMGPREYDLASLLLDPYVDIGGDDTIQEMLDHYGKIGGSPITQDSFCVAATQRLMQALGAFGNLSIHKGRDRYRAYIPVGLERLGRVLSRAPRFPHLARIVHDCLTSLNG